MSKHYPYGAKGLDSHPIFKLGKVKAQPDERNIKLASIIAGPVKLPREYDFDLSHPGIPTPMFANDTFGCCVIAARAHQTLRFELIEQGSPCMITDKDVIREYMKETGGPDTGLVVLESLKLWRVNGWKVGRRTYRIQAFAEVNRLSKAEVQGAIFAKLGVNIGLNLPLTAQRQIQSGQPLDVLSTKGDGAPGSWGGHDVYVTGWTAEGPICVTWGRKVPMTWRFFAAYCDEAYACIDAKDNKYINRKKLDEALKRATSA